MINEDDAPVDPDHEWHFRYNRRLSCFSQAVSCLAFSMDGQYLVSGTGSGDVKVWDTGSWAEAAKLKGCRKEDPKALVISPAQRWLAVCYASVLQIFNCSPPFRLEQAIPAILDPHTKEMAEWSCIAFSPMAEVDHPGGHTGQDNHLCAFSTSHLCVLDYSGGWGEDTPRRTRSLMQSAKPTCLAYTADGWWMICGFEGGQLQIWNAFSLTLEKTLSAHTESVNALTATPRGAQYESRIVSCGADQALRVWHSNGWVLEQHLHDTRCDRAGVLRCTFSCTGKWLVSVACELSVWRVSITRRNRLILQLHQRLEAICGSEGLRTAAFCSYNDAIAVGSRDGVLGLWTKYKGFPRDPVETGPPSTAAKNSASAGRSEAWLGERALPRPMQRITPQGLKPPPKPGQPKGDMFQRSHLRPMALAPLGSRTMIGLSSTSAVGRNIVSVSPAVSTSSREGTPEENSQRLEGPLSRGLSLPELRWKASSFEVNDVIAQKADGKCVASPDKRLSMHSTSSLSIDCSVMERGASLARKNMLHRCRGLVQRISLEPAMITEDPDRTS